jgi:hypothetical protein
MGCLLIAVFLLEVETLDRVACGDGRERERRCTFNGSFASRSIKSKDRERAMTPPEISGGKESKEIKDSPGPPQMPRTNSSSIKLPLRVGSIVSKVISS